MRVKLVVLLALMSCGLMAAETDMAQILARLKALETKNAELEQKLKQAEARPGTTAGVDKAQRALYRSGAAASSRASKIPKTSAIRIWSAVTIG